MKKIFNIPSQKHKLIKKLYAVHADTYYKSISAFFLSIFVLLIYTTPAFANLVIRPSQVSTAQTVLFDMGVPAEKNIPTIGVKLLIPNGVTDVIPNVKNGWTFTVKMNGQNVSEIDWSGGSIPEGARDDFYFEAQVPEKETLLKWNAYQTNKDGSVVSWTHAPTENAQDELSSPPYSTTRVISDFNVSTSDVDSDISVRVNFSVFLSVLSLILSLSSLILILRRKKSD